MSGQLVESGTVLDELPDRDEVRVIRTNRTQETARSTAFERPLWKRDERRYAERRASYLSRALGITENEAEVLAWREIGYSSSGIATQVGLSENAVRSHVETLADDYGPDTVLTKLPDEIGVDARVGDSV